MYAVEKGSGRFNERVQRSDWHSQFALPDVEIPLSSKRQLAERSREALGVVSGKTHEESTKPTNKSTI